jgi:hypothetical protein
MIKAIILILPALYPEPDEIEFVISALFLLFFDGLGQGAFALSVRGSAPYAVTSLPAAAVRLGASLNSLTYRRTPLALFMKLSAGSIDLSIVARDYCLASGGMIGVSIM